VTEPQILPVERLDLRFAPRAWAFADDNRAAIDAHFAVKQKANPSLWNGRVLLAHEYSVADRICFGAFLETDFASFNAWRDWGRPPAGIINCFAAPALRASDSAFLLGVMGNHTANAGQIYFPCGTPEPIDVVDGHVDLEHSARHELKNETGLDFEELDPEPGWLSVRLQTWAMVVKVLQAREGAEALRRRILGHLASQAQPELAGIRIVRGSSDLCPAMPPFVSAFLSICGRRAALLQARPAIR
jgi:hypothetical protein